MRLSRSALALGIALAANIVLALLLSPLGFERRTPADLTSLGYVAIATVAAGVFTDLAAIVFIALRRLRAASRLAIAGSIVFLFPNIVDQAGAFFTLPAPPTIDALEYAFIVVLVVTLILAWRVHQAAGSPAS